MLSFGFWSSYLKVYIHLTCINTQQQTTSPFSSWLLLSRVSLIYWYNGNTVLRLVWYRLVLILIILKFISIYPASTHTATNNFTILFVVAIATGEFTILILWKYGFKVCVILFGFYSSHFKVYIYLPCINTQWKTTKPFYLWLSLSHASLLYWYYENTVLRFVWYLLALIQIILKFISI